MGKNHKWKKICPMCKTEFDAYRSDAVFDKPECRKEFNYLKNKHPEAAAEISGIHVDDLKKKYPPSHSTLAWSGTQAQFNKVFTKKNASIELINWVASLGQENSSPTIVEDYAAFTLYCYHFPNKPKPIECWKMEKGRKKK